MFNYTYNLKSTLENFKFTHTLYDIIYKPLFLLQKVKRKWTQKLTFLYLKIILQTKLGYKWKNKSTLIFTLDITKDWVVTGKKSSGDIPDLSSSGCRGEGLTTGLLGGLLTGLLVLLDLVGAGCLTGSISPSNKFFTIFYAMCRQ